MVAALPFLLEAGIGVAASVGLQGGANKQAAAATAAQQQAQKLQQRQIFAAQEDSAVLNSQQSASDRQLRTLGRRQLAFQGNELGVPTDLTGGAAPASGS